MFTRRKLLVGLGLGVLSPAFPSFAQQAGNAPQIGLLWIKQEGSAPYLAALREGLRAHGYVEGRNIRIDERFLVQGYEGFAEAAGKLVGEKPAVIVAFGATAILSARKATTSIPIVMVGGGDPVKLGIAASLSRPGGNVTGVTLLSTELSGKRLELLRELVPGLRRIAVVLYPHSQVEVMSLKIYEAAARTLNLEVRTVEVHSFDAIAPVISGIAKTNVGAIAFVGSTLFTANRKHVVAAVQKTGLPAVYANNDFVDAGGLVAYAPNISDSFRRAATYVDKILKGAKTGELPIEQPTTFELSINLRTAKALGITVPRTLLLRADRVIE